MRTAPQRPAVPLRGAWVTLDLTDGRRMTVRFVRAGFVVAGCKRWEFDHGAYGANRADVFIRVDVITRISPAQRPARALSFVDPFGKRQWVGRFATQEEADVAIAPWRRLVTDIRFREARQ